MVVVVVVVVRWWDFVWVGGSFCVCAGFLGSFCVSIVRIPLSLPMVLCSISMIVSLIPAHVRQCTTEIPDLFHLLMSLSQFGC